MTRHGWKGATVLVLTAVVGAAEPPGAPADVKAVVPTADVLPYNASNRRDPFRPPGTGVAAAEPRSPLERYELGQLRLVAIINGGETRAVVEDDAGLGFIVKLGTRIGPNGGQVQAIERGRVVVREEYVDFYGENHPTEVVMELKPGARPRDGERGRR